MLGFIVSPTKKMNVLEGPPYVEGVPRFIEKTKQLMRAVSALSYEEAQALWRTSDKLTSLNHERFATMDLTRNTTPAVIAYEGIQYQHLAPSIMDEDALAYLGQHLRILSGFYGVLAPFDGVVPYRLEMQAKLALGNTRDLYSFWGDALARSLAQEFDCLINLASVEYAKAVVPHAEATGLRVVTCLFGTIQAEKFVQRSPEVKAARGSFVCWCAERGFESAGKLTGFTERGYLFDPTRSSEDTLVFIKS